MIKKYKYIKITGNASTTRLTVRKNNESGATVAMSLNQQYSIANLGFTTEDMCVYIQAALSGQYAVVTVMFSNTAE